MYTDVRHTCCHVVSLGRISTALTYVQHGVEDSHGVEHSNLAADAIPL